MAAQQIQEGAPMATVSSDQVKALTQNWEPVGAALAACTAMKSALAEIQKLNGRDSAHQSTFDALPIQKIADLKKKGNKGFDTLKTAVTSEDDYNELRDNVRKLGVPFAKIVDKLKPLVAADLKDAKENGWRHKVIDTKSKVADLDKFDKTMVNKLKEIVEDGGRGDHGDTVLSGSAGRCKHWRVGAERIFGTMKSGKLVLVGTGRHSGKGNANYKVQLQTGGSCTATTD
jgi:hypothetical protein